METKTCSGCRLDKPLDSFYLRCGKTRKCHECRSVAKKAHYKANRERAIEVATTWKNGRIAKFAEFKTGKPCTDCGGFYAPYQMDFDHTGSGKIGSVSYMVRAKSWTAVLEEIAKCDLVCANCHRERTYGKASGRNPRNKSSET